MTWEERMAEKASQRRKIIEQAEFEQSQKEWEDIKNQWREQTAPMTVEEAREYLDNPSPGCACVGGPNCCIIRYEIAKKLVGE